MHGLDFSIASSGGADPEKQPRPLDIYRTVVSYVSGKNV